MNCVYWFSATIIFIEEEEEVTCGIVSKPVDGRVKLSGVRVGSTARYSCKRGFSLKGHAKRACMTNGHWSERAPMCVRRALNLC